MVNLNRSLGLEIYKKICNAKRFIWCPNGQKIVIKDLQGCTYTVTKEDDKYLVNNKIVDYDYDVIEKISKIIIDRDPLFQGPEVAVC